MNYEDNLNWLPCSPSLILTWVHIAEFNPNCMVDWSCCRAHITAHIVKAQEQEKKVHEVRLAMQTLQGQTKEQQRMASREHKKVKVR